MAKRARRLLAVAALVVLGTLGGCGWFANTEAVISPVASSGTVPFTVAFDGTASEGAGG